MVNIISCIGKHWTHHEERLLRKKHSQKTEEARHGNTPPQNFTIAENDSLRPKYNRNERTRHNLLDFTYILGSRAFPRLARFSVCPPPTSTFSSVLRRTAFFGARDFCCSLMLGTQIHPSHPWERYVVICLVY